MTFLRELVRCGQCGASYPVFPRDEDHLRDLQRQAAQCPCCEHQDQYPQEWDFSMLDSAHHSPSDSTAPSGRTALLLALFRHVPAKELAELVTYFRQLCESAANCHAHEIGQPQRRGDFVEAAWDLLLRQWPKSLRNSESIEALMNPDTRRRVSGLLIRMIRLRLISAYRGRAARASTLFSLRGDETAATAPAADAAMIEREGQSSVRIILAAVLGDDIELSLVASLRFVHGMSISEIAKKLDGDYWKIQRMIKDLFQRMKTSPVALRLAREYGIIPPAVAPTGKPTERQR